MSPSSVEHSSKDRQKPKSQPAPEAPGSQSVDSVEVAGLNARQSSVLQNQRARGNASVLRMLGKAPGQAVQRDLQAYNREHVDIVPTMDPDAGPPIMETYTADAPGIQTALQALISANKITTRTAGDKVTFSNVSATRDEIVAALTAASYSRAAAMADALLANHQISIYSREEVTKIPGLIWDTELGRRQQNLDVQTRRGLTGFERTEAAKVYGGSLNYDAIVLEDAPVMAIGGYARTTPWTINFPSGTLSGGGPSMNWLMHEMGHSWQYARGVSMIRTLYHAVRGVYAYGGEAALTAATAAGHGLNSFNTEQQTDIAKDAYEAIIAGRDLTAYQPFIDEFKSGTYR